MTEKPPVLLMGQTPPPWHGQAVATQILFDHAWPGHEVHRLRMEFSGEMLEVGRFQWKKVRHLWDLIRRARNVLKQNPGCILFYPPASAKWVPFIRDVIFLACVRHLAGGTVFIFHASGLPVFVQSGVVRKTIGQIAYSGPEVALEVAQELVTPHEAFGAKSWKWCPCGIEVPNLKRSPRRPSAPLTVLFVGSLQEGKGVLEIIRTARALKDQGLEKDFHFRIVGRWFSTEFEEETRSLCAELEVQEFVELVGELTGNDKWQAYLSADVFFFPTHYSSEATPIVLMEALGMGLPLVTTQWAGIPAMLRGCETAILLPIRSTEGFAVALHSLSLRRGEALQMQEASKRFYRDHFLPEKFVERVEHAFDQAVRLSSDHPGRACPAASAHPLHPTQEEPAQPGVRGELRHADLESRIGEALKPRDAATTEGTSNIELTTSNIEGRVKNPTFKTIPSPLGDLGELAVSRSVGTSNLELPTSNIETRVQKTDTTNQDLKPKIQDPKFKVTAYLADQNPGHDRSFGISRMSQVVLDALARLDGVEIEAVTSTTSQQPPESVEASRILPWGTRTKWVRLLTDHFHPLFLRSSGDSDVYYFPKGYLPLLSIYCRPSVVTIHDTIIQYDEDHYPKWRHRWEYGYWSKMLKHTLLRADRIMTVSESSKAQVEAFMRRHAIPPKPIIVTYEPCLYEGLEQPLEPHKENYVIHLASREPHKRTAHLIRWWHQAEMCGRELPTLHLIGSVPPEVMPLLANSHSIVRRAFLSEPALQAVYLEASALILPSEIEGFGLPALEAYYLGTPVCFVMGTSVEEILAAATSKGGFNLDDPKSLFAAVDQVLSMSPQEVRECGLKLRHAYAAEKVAERMLDVFNDARNG